MDDLLAKSLHSLSHNQLSAIASVIRQMQILKQFAETEWTEPVVDETTPPDEVPFATVLPPTTPESNTEVLSESEPETDDTQANNTYMRSITIQCHLVLYASMQSQIEAWHRNNDFSFTSVTDIIREALKAYQDGMELTEPCEAGRKKQTSIRVDNSLYQFYKSLPSQMRTTILDRAIRTYIHK